MIGGRRVLGLIVARGGSKGLPGKNTRMLGGQPLIAWTIRAARAAAHIDRLVLSSDSDEIMRVAREHGCDVPFRRPDRLASDDAGMVDVVQHALAEVPGYDVCLLLQATSPLRTAEDIDGFLDFFAASGSPTALSVAAVEKSPYWMYTLAPDARLERLLSDRFATRRQELPAVYAVNGALYAVDTAWFARERTFHHADTVGFVMPRERSVDIDSEFDFMIAEAVMARRAAE